MCIADTAPSLQAVVRISVDAIATSERDDAVYEIYSAQSSGSSRTPSNSDPVDSDIGSGGETTTQPNTSADSPYTMIAPVQVGSQLNNSAPCFALGGNNVFQVTCSNNPRSSSSIHIPIYANSDFNTGLFAFMSSQSSTKLFTVTTDHKGIEYDFSQVNQADDSRTDPTVTIFQPYQEKLNSRDHSDAHFKRVDDKFVVISNNSTKLSALWIPSNYNGTFVHLIEATPPTSSGNTGSLEYKTVFFPSALANVNVANISMVVDPNTGGGTVIVASTSDGTSTGQIISNFNSIPQEAFGSGVDAVNPGDSSSDTTNSPDSAGGMSGGAIAGAVVGSILGAAILIGLLIFCLKRRRKSRSQEFESLSGEKSKTSTAASWPFVSRGGDNDNAGSSAVKQYGDIGNVTNIRQISVSSTELEALEPTSPLADGAVVLGGLYQFTRDSPSFLDEQQSRIPKYAMRGVVYQNGGQTYTLHYFISKARDSFIRNVTTTCALGTSSRVIQHRDAIAMNNPTPRGGYQYLWITEPSLPQQSLHYILTGSDKSIDIHDYPFKAWSTYALLEALKDVHTANFVHLGLTPYSFYYNDIDSVSDWQVTGFDQTHSIGERVNEIHLNQWSAPELFATASNDNRRCFRQTVQPASDIWSLGCIIYTLATGRNLTIDLNQTAQLSKRDRDQLYIHVTSACNEAGAVEESYRTLLEGMLQPEPSKRSTAANLAAYWKEANGLYDDNEEENNEAEESVVTP
ncbi:hypothetical protein INT45_007466 [Circinella minor]|uniref:Protein kinase domain-containing protein n=1 Tax=Circinella minor TaxID=1195481 RepID=A0A8H7SE47_9FUNG|nr:hypothetical protein INT45_007466 [Circinella minor]